ncbi:MAG TPA: thioesterase family protein [Anaerolineales bacterium]
MDPAEIIQPGMSLETTFVVETQHSAAHIGSGSLRVLATPVMISFMESTSHRLLAQHLPQGYSSVGVLVNVRHLAPTPLGSTVRVRSEVQALEGSRVIFRLQAWDSTELVGEGEHQRMVIDEARFLRRVAAKSAALADAG